MGDWVDELCVIFEQEIDLYKRLLEIEWKKRDAINHADGKSLREYSQQTYNLMVSAAELERVRMKSIEEFYKSQDQEIRKSEITLSDFLNKIDRDSNYRLKDYATDLKSTVHKLKEAVLVNERLIQTRQELLQKTIQEIQKADSEITYLPEKMTRSGYKKSSAKSIVLDASV